MAVRLESQAEPIPGYKLIERIGGGGFGEVWKAIAPGGLLKAIKFVYGTLDSTDPDAARAGQELKALSRVRSVRHPFILSLERIDIIDNQLLIVMELADRNLWDRYRECRNQGLVGLPREELLGYMTEAAEALDLMNQDYDLQHLDIKPQNIFLIHNHIKVADFGLVKDLEGLVASVTGGVTPIYAAPETFDGWVSRFSDQYSLAIVYQELLTGKRPFAGTNTRQLIMQHLQGKPDVEPAPPGDRGALERALSKTPTDRFPSCMDFVNWLQKATNRVTPPPSEPPPSGGTPEASVRTENLQEIAAKKAPEAEAGVPPTDVQPPQLVFAAPPTPVLSARVRSVEPSLLASLPAIQPDFPPRAEERGEGLLFPALVIGLGQTGLEVLRRFRLAMLSHGHLRDQCPQVQMLYIDTDPECHQAAAEGPSGQSLDMDEVQIARLSRPTRYLRPRDSLPRVEDWLNLKMVYRIPRSLTTMGIRGLGRLAFIDNYRAIVSRLRRDLQQITAKETLALAVRNLGVGLRSNWPRVYLLAALGGGTGGGMFLDLAYVCRQVLRLMGYERPDVNGLLFLPPIDPNANESAAAANTYASLVELHHFASTETTFKARYEAKMPMLQDPGAPFRRALLIPLGGSADAIDVAGDYLFRTILSPLGREAERAGRPIEAEEEPSYRSIGISVLASPRATMIRLAAGQLARALVEHWNRKSTPEMAPAIRQEMLECFQQEQLDPAGVRDQLRAAAARTVAKPLTTLFAEWTEPIASGLPQQLPQSLHVAALLQEVHELLGSPVESWRPALLSTALREAAEEMARHAQQILASLIAAWVDRPGYRLGAAEESVQQAVECIEEWLRQHEKQAEQLLARLQQLRERIQGCAAECERLEAGGKLSPARRAHLVSEINESVLPYPRLFFENLLTVRMTSVYISLRGHLSDQVKELGFCRKRLQALQQLLADKQDQARQQEESKAGGPGDLLLLPTGCRTVDEAAGQIVQAFPPEEIERLDVVVHDALGDQVPSLMALCLSPGDLLKDLQRQLQREVEAILEQRLPLHDVAELFFQQRKDEAGNAQLLKETSERAAATFVANTTTPENYLRMVAAPNTRSGQQFLQLVSKVLPGTRTLAAESRDEIIFYWEIVGLALQQLEEVGKAGRVAYELSCSMDHFTPHTRRDITAWREVRRAVSEEFVSQPDVG